MQTDYEAAAKEPLDKIAPRAFQQLPSLAGFSPLGCRNCAVEAALIPEQIEIPRIAQSRTMRRQILPLHLLQNRRQLLNLREHVLRLLRRRQNHLLRLLPIL